MNVIVNIKDVNINYVFFQDAVKNTVMDEGKFSRLLYSNSLFTLSGLFVAFHIKVLTTEKLFNKFKCLLDKTLNQSEIMQVSALEKELLYKASLLLNLHGKSPVYRIGEQLNNGVMKVFNDRSKLDMYVLKIYGIWETENEYGLTYKMNACDLAV